ncbi:outer membrane lipid asymmetry maintenance protein MlaD [Oceaniglobus ichthyenteri]|uniref:outer membrane lipid asymmetry maintenance protein MlaD n=1 Tax=Oceaniglobus ichthyenteri TaxID=2136177 RepID=UPI000D39976A|nr:outer membrane lipid asymmetry maintenance protein MlaD [Oceaniglobus ichthyenteri]
MADHMTEVVTGGVVLAAALGFGLYAAQVAGLGQGGDTYPLTASFRSVEGVSVGSDVRLGGVRVGTVTALNLNAETFRADAVFAIRKDLELPEDTAVIVASEGLLGGNFIEILPGGSPFNLEQGSEIEDTQSAVSLLNLLLKYVSGGSD